MLGSWASEWLSRPTENEPKLPEVVKVNIQYAEGNCVPAAECYFDPGSLCIEYDHQLRDKVGKGQMFRGPITLLPSTRLNAGEYTYLIPGVEPAGKKPVLVPHGALKEADGCAGLSDEMKQHMDRIVTSRLNEALGVLSAKKK